MLKRVKVEQIIIPLEINVFLYLIIIFKICKM